MSSTFQKAVDVLSPIHIEYISEGDVCPKHGAEMRIMPKHVTFDHLVGESPRQKNIGQGKSHWAFRM
jgi:hypothetical protein